MVGCPYSDLVMTVTVTEMLSNELASLGLPQELQFLHTAIIVVSHLTSVRAVFLRKRGAGMMRAFRLRLVFGTLIGCGIPHANTV